MVQTNTVEGPGAGDAGVIRIKGSQRGLAMALDGNGRWCYLDPKLGAMHAVAEAARNVACSGATPVAATNCLNFGNPEKPHIMWQFSQAIDGISKACEALATPVTGGNVSFYNETLGEGIYPTPVLGIVGILEDVHKAVFPHFREPGRAIVLLRADQNRAMRSMLSQSLVRPSTPKRFLGSVWGFPPALELDREAALQKAVIEIINLGLVDSAHDCSDGGIAVTLAESAFSRDIGFKVDLHSQDLAPEFVLFGEDASRMVISCDPANVSRIKQVAVNSGISAEQIGETVSEQAEVSIDGAVIVSAKVSELRDSFEGAIERVLKADAELVAV